ncbi:MAG: CHAT domain-containing protein [Chloroflexota bacterium]
MTNHSSQPTYDVFELLIGQASADATYPLTITQAPAGEGTGISTIDPQDEELQDALAALEDGDFDAEFLQDVGAFLFEEVFPDEIISLLRSSINLVRGRDYDEEDDAAQHLRIRLRIEAPELATLPWELLFDGDEDAFIAISPELPLVRYVPARLPARPMQITPPLRLLIVIASPDDLGPLGFDEIDTAQEQTIILEALSDLVDQDRIQVHIVDHGTPANISQAMRSFRPHIFHFIGHGVYDGDVAHVVLEDDEGNAEPVNERTFREFFTGSNDTRLVILNACQTATASSIRPLAGLAPLILQRKLSAVIAMQYPISDHAAHVFSREFYRSLATGYPVDASVAEARKGIYMDGDTTALDWVVPVLFMRSKDGRLFELDEPEPATTSLQIPPPPEPTPPPFVLDGFVGRERELAVYHKEIQKLGRTVITGMLGTGKTALAAELVRRYVYDDHKKVFWYSFRPDEDANVLIWKLAAFLAWHKQPDLWEMIQSMYQTGGTLPPAPVLLDYAVQLLSKDKYAICLDDIHFINEDSILNSDMLVEKLRTLIADGKLQLIITSQQVPDFVPISQMIPLEGMTPHDSLQLLQANGITLDGSLYHALHERTDGNVQFLHLAIEAIKQTGKPERVIERLAMTNDVERYLVAEIDDTLDEDAREVMSGIAVLMGHLSSRDVIEFVTEHEHTWHILTELSQLNLLLVDNEHAKHRYYQNPIIRAFYYDRLGRRERRAMHFRAGEYHREEEFDPYLAAYHMEKAGEVEEAAELVTAYMHDIRQSGNTTPILSLLNTLNPRKLEPELWAKVCAAKGLIYRQRSEIELARESYQEAMTQLSHVPDSPPIYQSRAEICLWAGYTLLNHSLHDADRWVERGFDIIKEQTEGKAIDRIFGKLVDISEPRKRASRRKSTRAKQTESKEVKPDKPRRRRQTASLDNLLDKLDEKNAIKPFTFPQTEAGLHIVMASVRLQEGDAQEGLRLVQIGLDQLPHEQRNQRTRLHGLTVLGQIYVQLRHYEQGRDTLLQALKLAEEIGYAMQQGLILNNLMGVVFFMGEWQQALDYLHRAIEISGQTGSIVIQTRLQLNAGFIATDLGDDTTAETYLQQTLLMAETHNLKRFQMLGRSYLARLYIRQKSADRVALAVMMLAEAEKMAEDSGFQAVLPDIHRRFAQAYLLQNQTNNALTAATKSVTIAEELSSKSEIGKGLRVLAQVYSAGELMTAQDMTAQDMTAQDMAVVDDAFTRSLDLLKKEPYDHARTQVALARYLLKFDRSALQHTINVDELLDEAEATFERLGAERDALECSQLR